MGGEFSRREDAAYVRKGNWWMTQVLQGTHQELWVHQVEGTWEHLLARRSLCQEAGVQLGNK